MTCSNHAWSVYLGIGEGGCVDVMHDLVEQRAVRIATIAFQPVEVDEGMDHLMQQRLLQINGRPVLQATYHCSTRPGARYVMEGMSSCVT